MASFNQDDVTYGYHNPIGFESHEDVRSWEYGKYPKVLATVPLADGGTVDVYGESTRWSPTHISVQWAVHDGHTIWAWIPKANVRRAIGVGHRPVPPLRRSEPRHPVGRSTAWIYPGKLGIH